MVRTRVGYTGGKKLNPTYYNLGDHTETLQLDYDPTLISYEQLLDIFWNSHNPTRGAWSQQYKAAVFVHNEEQERLALETRDQLAQEKTGRFFNRKIQTDIIPASTFYLAEDYHQKYSLRQTAQLIREYETIYPQLDDFVNSTAVTRVNGYVGGHGSLAQLEAELDNLGLSEGSRQQLQKIVERFERYR